MDDPLPHEARLAPAATRNRAAILAALRPHLPNAGLVLEIAAGSGEHALHFAAALPALRWLPSDPDPEARASIAAWRAHSGTPNLLPPVAADARDPASWPVAQAAAVVCINMAHIAPWEATVGLMTGARRILPTGGILFLYGPFFEDQRETAPSNRAFDLDLRSRDPAWGLRALSDVDAAARREGLRRRARIAMPANNLSLVYRTG
ncbi:DUF938 domain-containing protein [Methylobacterium sp. PvR107]|uniref:DUF938 domain-containing protein n=1 Tax=Methylobacterium sp. PvR107 TaxID=2806597 RepID=UPI001AE7A3AD|nr:DUF938 domain-containing protein [Methylobacterium sp. PvR107]MBP1180974.1 hypothetical protein [Methylobacterium sp. PvR107]